MLVSVHVFIIGTVAHAGTWDLTALLQKENKEQHIQTIA